MSLSAVCVYDSTQTINRRTWFSSTWPTAIWRPFWGTTIQSAGRQTLATQTNRNQQLSRSVCHHSHRVYRHHRARLMTLILGTVSLWVRTLVTFNRNMKRERGGTLKAHSDCARCRAMYDAQIKTVSHVPSAWQSAATHTLILLSTATRAVWMKLKGHIGSVWCQQRESVIAY